MPNRRYNSKGEEIGGSYGVEIARRMAVLEEAKRPFGERGVRRHDLGKLARMRGLVQHLYYLSGMTPPSFCGERIVPVDRRMNADR